jgi:methionine sulfoxide reductase heme-binding subunit
VNQAVAALWVVSLVAVMFSASGDSDAYSAAVAGARALGYHALVFLSAALCVSPLRRWLPRRAVLRRALGLAAAGSALLHGAVGLGTSPLTWTEQLADPQLRFGIGAFIVLVLLGLTSFPRLVAALRLRSWKELHRLAYVAWICALLHGLLSPYAWMYGLLALAAVVSALAPLRFLPQRPGNEP